MSRGSRRRGGAHHGSDHPDERWMASYLDMITVLMCLFIVLYAMSNVDKGKYEELRDSLSAAFGREAVEGEPVLSGGVGEEGNAEEPEDIELTDLQRAELELAHLRQLREQIRTRLAEHGLDHLVEFGIDARGLSVKLVGSETFFDGNSASLRAEAKAVLDSVAPVLRSIDNQVTVEGHADPRGNPAPFPTDWELSSGRATGVLRHLVEAGGVAPQRVSSVGFGSARPVSTADGKQNRRVDIVVLSKEPEAIRGLIPELLKKEAQADHAAAAAAEEAAGEAAVAEEEAEAGGH